MILFDSDIATLIYYGKNQNVLTRYESIPETEFFGLSIVTRAEILRGRLDAVLKADSGENWVQAELHLRDTEAWLSEFEIIEIGRGHVQYDQIRQEKKSKFKGGHADLLNACIALANDATLVTRNVKDYRGIPNLKIENWAA